MREKPASLALPGVESGCGRMKSSKAKSALFSAVAVFLVWGLANFVVAITHWDKPGEEKFYSDVYSILNEVLPGAEIPFANAGSELERVNNLGYRGPDTSWEKPAGIRRLVSVGDSTTFGVFVSYRQSYTGILAEKLRNRGGWETVNAAIPGTNILQHRLEFQYKVYRLGADIVMVYVVPNVRDDLDAFREVHDIHARLQNDKTTALQKFMRSWPLYRLMRNVMKGPKAAGIKNQVEIIYTERRSMSDSRRYLDGFEKDLSALRKEILQSGAVPLWIWHINRRTVADHVLDKTPMESIVFNPMSKAPEDYYGVLKSFAENNHDALVNPYPLVVEQALKGAELFVDVVHPTAKGHELIAEAVWQKLKAIL